MSEDDWETADLSTNLSAAAKAKSKLALRPSAPTFQPRPSTSPTDAGPSRPPSTSNVGGYASRSPLPQNGDNGRGSPMGSGGGAGGDEWFRGPRPASNRQIWDAANNHLPSPIPTSIISNPTLASPMPQPGITILRRQPGGNEKKKGGGNQTPPKTMEEREEEYRLVRERIFGGNVAGVEAEGGAERSRSGNGRARTPLAQAGERTESPANRVYEQQGLGPVPVQVRRSPAPSAVLRQPMGPGEGGGFGR